jgi:tRNA-specific adenosine deaminase 1
MRVSWVPLPSLWVALLALTLPSTGMKCLPRSKIPHANGTVLHDWHAEILAIRAFNRFLIQECASIVNSGSPSLYLRRRGPEEMAEHSSQYFTFMSDVSIYMYCSEAPCGDASMELIMQAQDDPTPWNLPVPTAGGDGMPDSLVADLKGRGYFSELGIVRRKPCKTHDREYTYDLR